MRASFFPKLAAEGIRKNRRLYGPYLITCVMMVAIYYILSFLAYSGIMDGMAGGGTATDMMRLGTYVVTVFSLIFLFYTQSTLIKGRKKEFGLLSVLGMNKHNLGCIIFYETVMVWVLALLGGLAAGIGLSKFAELGFTRLIAVPTRYSFSISKKSVILTVIVFTVIFFLIYLNSARQIRFSSPMELITAEKAGEKPPKSNWFVGVLGLVFLGSGYYLALKIQQPLAALLWFFGAAILVIIGTYLILVAGSVLLCRILQKNEGYYYRADHFVAVSSMAYRMKRNGAGLASICILLTGILVMLSSTSALYTGADECLNSHYPSEINSFACKYGYDEELASLGDKLEEKTRSVATAYGVNLTNEKTFYDYSISGYLEDSRLDIVLNSKTNLAFINYDKVAQIMFIDVDDYNRVFGYNEVVGPGEAILGTSKKIEIGNVFTVGDEEFRITKRIDDRVGEIDPSARGSAAPGIFMIVKDVHEVASHYTQYTDYDGEPMLAWFWNSRFDTGLDVEGQIAVAQALDQMMKEELDRVSLDNAYSESHEAERDDFVSTFGGLFFLGILLSLIFLVSCVIIIYYKQVSEGYEDQARFGIMQKVGMAKEDISRSINSQMRIVFLIPIVLACVHLLMVLPIVHKILMLFGLFDMVRLLVCAGVCALLCGVFYAVCYRLTSQAYYTIVS